MNGVLGLTELLLQSEPTTEQREHLELISRSGRSLITIISDVLNLTSLESGAMTLELQAVNPTEVTRDVVALLKPGAVSRGLTLELQGQAPPSVHADPTRLRQILSNLVGNALKFTDAGGVLVTLGPVTEGRFEVTVSDTGVGVPEAGRTKLFTPFFQADESSTRRHGGTGLGLALSRQLARAMGGDVTYAPAATGGSVFTLVLPAS
jgi:signal transduction histidine kinase